MNKNLTPEQVEQLKKELAKLPPEKLEELKKQQCPFCLIAANKIPSRKLFEDNRVVAALDINPATNGHTLIFTKKHHQTSLSMPDEEYTHLFLMANKISLALVKSLNAEGINIFVANGERAGQKVDHAIVHLIPRYKGDNVNLEWEPRKASDQELEIIQKKVMQDIKPVEKVEKPREAIKPGDVERFIFNPEKRLP